MSLRITCYASRRNGDFRNWSIKVVRSLVASFALSLGRHNRLYMDIWSVVGDDCKLVLAFSSIALKSSVSTAKSLATID